MRRRTFVIAVPLLGAALVSSCDSLECGAGTHEEGGACVADPAACLCGVGTVSVPTDDGCECVPDGLSCPCGPGTVSEPTEDGCQCVPLPPLPGVRVCACMNRPSPFCEIVLPGACAAESDDPIQVLATASDGAGGYSLVGGDGIAVTVAGGTAKVHGLLHPFTLDRQPAHVPLAVEDDGSFATAPGDQLFEWVMVVVPGQPPLPLRGVSITGALDEDGRPGSPGRIIGCYALEDAAAIYIELLTQTFAELTQNSGAVPDCDYTGSGSMDGYTLDLSWGGVPVDVVE
jgi:hypothetical protein